ncbi:MAG: hypothetical protein ABI680_18830 [Chthoniobacteraceae bacterium]
MSDEFQNPINEGSATRENANAESKDRLSEAKKHARLAADDLRAAAEVKARELKSAAEAKVREYRETAGVKAGEFRGKAEHYYEGARARARTFQEEGETFVRKEPLKAIVYALAAGFLLGTIFKSR